MTSLAGGYAKIISLEATFGSDSEFDVEVENAEIVKGNLSGACGELVVDKVYVGKGRRHLAAASKGHGGMNVSVPGAPIGGNVDAERSKEEGLEWTVNQAYGFTTSENSKTKPLGLTAYIPSIMSEGDEVEVTFKSEQPAWLVVYYIDGSGHGDVLWPSNEEPEPYVAPDQPAVLPSVREKARGFHLQASVLKPGEPSRETLVVYGFADKRDFNIRKPSAGAENADGPAYAASLTRELQGIPMNRWSRSIVGYVIQPKK
jgi:hypothetical protein